MMTVAVVRMSVPMVMVVMMSRAGMMLHMAIGFVAMLAL